MRGRDVRLRELAGAQSLRKGLERRRRDRPDTGKQLSLGEVAWSHAEDGAGRASRAGSEQDAPRDGAELAGEIQLGDRQQGSWRSGDLIAGVEQGGGQRQVEREPTLGQLRRHEIKEHARLWERETSMLECRGEALFGFARCEVGEADDLHAR